MSFRRKLLFAIVALGVFFFGARWLYRELASDETKIRWCVEGMVNGFNDCKTGRVLAGLATDFHDRTSGATRADVHGALVQLFFEQVDSTTHKFALHAELLADELVIAIQDGDPPQADVSLHMLLRERDGEKLFWDARIVGRMERRLDGWQWVETTDVNHRDRRRGR